MGGLDAEIFNSIIKAVASSSINHNIQLHFSERMYTPEAIQVMELGDAAIRIIPVDVIGTEAVLLGLLAEGPSTPSVALMDSQSVKTGGCIHQAVGYDGGKQVKGRKRHLLVDTLGLVIIVVVTAANGSDPAAAKTLFARLERQRRRFNRLFLIYTNGTYRGEAFVHWVFDTYRWILEAVTRQDQRKGFQVLPKRWIVERTLAWLSNCRRLSKDYERSPQTSETFIYLAMTRLMLKRLA